MHGLAALEAGRSTAISLPPHGYGRTGERQVELPLSHRPAERIAVDAIAMITASVPSVASSNFARETSHSS